jgi:hypothetical protein
MAKKQDIKDIPEEVSNEIEKVADEVSEDVKDELIQELAEHLNPTTKFIFESFRFHTAQGRIMIPKQNIDYFYEGPKGKPTVRTKSGKNIEILEDIFSFMRWEEKIEED